MEYDLKLTQLTFLALFALMGGLGFAKIKQPPILGYMLCGVILGPSLLSIIHELDYVVFLSDLGIIFLMFVVGFELHLDYFKDIWKLAIGCTIAQIIVCLAIMSLLSLVTHWPLQLIFLYGFIGALSSTSTVVKMLENMDQTDTENGQRAIAILIAQDLALVPMIILLQNFQQGQLNVFVFFKIFLSMILVGLLVIFLSVKTEISLPFSRIMFRDKELVTLTSFAFCVGSAWISGLLGLSEAFGAFLAGLFLGNTQQQKILLDTIKPVQTLLLMIFFFSTGLLLDIHHIWHYIWPFLGLLFAVTVGKSFMNITILHALRLSWADAFFIGALLSQIGEFSFLLVKIGRDLHILTRDQEKLIVGITVASFAFSPIWSRIARDMSKLANVNIVSFKTTIGYSFNQTFKIRTKRLVFWVKSYLTKPPKKKD